MSYIQLINVCKTIKKNVVLDHISLSLERNKVYGVQGVNGSGKTMLLRAICGLMYTEGDVFIDGKSPCGNGDPMDIGVMIEMPGFLKEFTGKENLQLLALLQNRIQENDITEALELVGLQPEDPRRYGKYSLGMKQRLGIAQAILCQPELILLDEPTNAIDSNGIEQIKTLIMNLKKQGCTIIITSHDKAFLMETADEVIVMEGGRILCQQ